MSSVYLGAAIDLASDLNAFDEMSDILTKTETFKNSIIFRPDKAYFNAKNITDNPAGIEYLMQVNDYALLSADLAVFYVSKNVFSAGVAHEIETRLSSPGMTYIIAEKLGFYTRGQVNRANAHNNGPWARIYSSIEDFKTNFEEHYKKDCMI
jgi:hypothetical protein